MALPDFSMRQLLEAGAHFGHQTHRWNPKMDRFIFGARSNIHIIDLSQTVPLLHQALVAAREVGAKGGRVLFVGTKRQASDPIAAAAARCAQYFVNHRWLGGTMTNWATISHSIARLRELENILGQDDVVGLTKKELLNLTRERDKLERSLGGIKEMSGIPDLMFVIDTNKEQIAINEAKKLGIPVIAIIDTNCDPDRVDYPIPGNDDAARAITLYCDLLADAILDGMAAGQEASGADLGEAEAPVERALQNAGDEMAAGAEGGDAKPAKEAPAKEEAKAKAKPAKDDAKPANVAKAEATPTKEEAAPAKEEAKAEPKAEAKPEPKADAKAEAKEDAKAETADDAAKPEAEAAKSDESGEKEKA